MAPKPVTDRIYAPPHWSTTDFDPGKESYRKLFQIAEKTRTSLAYHKATHAIEIVGMNADTVLNARQHLENMLSQTTVKNPRQWARPERPGIWGQRRDKLSTKTPCESELRRELKLNSDKQNVAL